MISSDSTTTFPGSGVGCSLGTKSRYPDSLNSVMYAPARVSTQRKSIGSPGVYFANNIVLFIIIHFDVPLPYLDIKNDGISPVELEVQLAGMPDGTTIKTKFDCGWNPEIVKVIKATSLSSINLKFGY